MIAVAVSDMDFAKTTGYPLDSMNRFGSSLIFGHSQGPTGPRSIADVIRQIRERGAAAGLFTGCAGGDTAAAVVIRV